MYDDQIDDWLQVKGDPAVRALVFEQTRVQSLFDDHFDRLIQVGEELLSRHGVYQLLIHFSSNQLICWTYENPYSYKVYVGEDIFSESFLEGFRTPVVLTPFAQMSIPCRISIHQLCPVLEQFKRLRFKDENIYLRNASINRINGYISMTFSCDGSHYIPFRDFFKTVSQF